MLETITIEEDDLGLTYEQKVTYEWRPPHCSSCGVFGHGQCAVQQKEMEKETTSREKVMQQDVNRIEEQQYLLMKTGNMAESLGRFQQEKMKEVEDDEGWERVRARKKRSDRFGATKTGQTRPGSQSFNTGQNVVSSTHWRALNPAGDQVSQPDLLPNEGVFLNSKSCPQPESGPLSPSENDNLNNDTPTPLFEPLADPKHSDKMSLEPTVSGSSAGHTPFPNRLASMARDLRRRHIRISGLSLSGLGPKSVGVTATGFNRTDTKVPNASSPKAGTNRNEKVHELGLSETGNTDQVTARVKDNANRLTRNEKENRMKLQGGRALGEGMITHKAACPPSSLGFSDLVGVCKSSFSAQVDHAVQKPLNSCGPPSPRSSAGHTPFPSRISQMARELRLGRVGRTSGFLPKTPSLSAGPKCGLDEGEKTFISPGLGLHVGLNSAATDGLQKEQNLAMPSAEIGGCNMDVGRGLSWSVTNVTQKEKFSPSQVDRGKENGIPSVQNVPYLTDSLLTEVEGGNGHERRKDLNGSLGSSLGRCADQGFARK